MTVADDEERKKIILEEGGFTEQDNGEELVRRGVLLHAVAFNSGKISLERLLEVLVGPFILLLDKMNQRDDMSAQRREALEGYLYYWYFSWHQGLDGQLIQDSEGVTRIVPLMTVDKRAQVMQTMAGGLVPKVSVKTFTTNPS